MLTTQRRSHLDNVGVVDRRQQPPLVEHVLHLLQPQQLLLAQHLQRDEAVIRSPPGQLDAPKGAGACDPKGKQWQSYATHDFCCQHFGCRHASASWIQLLLKVWNPMLQNLYFGQ